MHGGCAAKADCPAALFVIPTPRFAAQLSVTRVGSPALVVVRFCATSSSFQFLLFDSTIIIIFLAVMRKNQPVATLDQGNSVKKVVLGIFSMGSFSSSNHP